MKLIRSLSISPNCKYQLIGEGSLRTCLPGWHLLEPSSLFLNLSGEGTSADWVKRSCRGLVLARRREKQMETLTLF